MKSFITLAMAISASATLVGRDVPTVLADLDTIQTDIGALETAINNYQNFDQGAQPLLTAEGNLETAIKQGTTDTQATSGVTDDQAVQVLTKIKALIPVIVGAVNAATSKSALFASTGVGGIVTTKLATLKDLTDSFADALISKAPESATSAGNAAKSCIDSIFSAGSATPPTQASDCSANVVIPSGGGGGGSSSSSTTTTTASSSSSSASSSSASSSTTSSSSGGAVTTTKSSSTGAGSSSTTTSSAPATSSTTAYTAGAATFAAGGLAAVAIVGNVLFAL